MVFKSGVVVSAPDSSVDHAGIFQATEAVVVVLSEILLTAVTTVGELSMSSPFIVMFNVPESSTTDVN